MIFIHCPGEEDEENNGKETEKSSGKYWCPLQIFLFFIRKIELEFWNFLHLNTLPLDHKAPISPGMDSGFPVGRGADAPGGYQHTILPKFLKKKKKNCMKLRKFWAMGFFGGRAGALSVTELITLQMHL